MAADIELVQRIAQNDRTAMKELYDRYSGPLCAFLRGRIGGDSFEAADLMQEVFLEVWRNAHRFEGRSAVKTWLFGIGRNKSVDRVRKLSRHVVQPPDDTIPDDTPNAEAVVAAASDATRLQRCIAKLSEAHRAAIRLAFYDDMTYPEIAEIEDVPVGTIKTRIHAAKQLLMRCVTAAA